MGGNKHFFEGVILQHSLFLACLPDTRKLLLDTLETVFGCADIITSETVTHSKLALI